MRSSVWRSLGKLLAVLLCGIAVGFLLILAVYALPVEPMVQNVKASVPAFNGEWAQENMNEQLLPGYQTTQLDNTTDAAMLLLAVYDGQEPLVERATECYRYVSEQTTYQQFLQFGEADPSTWKRAPVARYWHGYLVLLKPLLLFMSYIDIRMVLQLAQGAMLAAVLAGLCKRGLWRLVPAFAVSLLVVTPTIAGFSMQFSTVFCTFLSAMLLLLYLPAKCFQGEKLLLFFLLLGMSTSFVDYLTYPVAAFGMPFVVCISLFPASSASQEWKRFILCGICWAVGYFGMWAGKWVIAGLFGNEQWFWANLAAKITERSSDVSGDVVLSYGDVLRSVLGIFVKRAYLLAGVVLALGWLAYMVWEKRQKRQTAKPSIAYQLVLLLTAVIPFAWYFVTQNHTYNHAFFTSRGLCVTVFALSVCLMRHAPQQIENFRDAG